MSKNAIRGGRGGGIRAVVRTAPPAANGSVPSNTGVYYGGVKDTTGKTVEYSVRRRVLDARAGCGGRVADFHRVCRRKTISAPSARLSGTSARE